tara:strand:- start:4097 stop:5500 length:1404 start_codon:yes stop_codon:yes gene_type:complete
MLNKFYKIIHNRYSRFFEFIFFIRYLFVIFFISIAIFLIIPYFFNYEKRADLIKNNLLQDYNIKITEYQNIKFDALPLPTLTLRNVKASFQSSEANLNIKNLVIYPRFLSIINLRNFQINKLVLEDSDISIKIFGIINFIKQILNNEKKLALNNFNLKIAEKNNQIISLENITLTNFGYSENLASGKIFDKKFKLLIDEGIKNINFTLVKSGISAQINLDENSKKKSIKGIFKSKILDKNLKFNFDYNEGVLKISNSYFRGKDLSFKSSSTIIFKPYLDFDSFINVTELNTIFFKNLNLDKLLEKKDLIKKINGKKTFNFTPKKLSHNLIDELSLKVDLAYGNLGYSKKFSISNNYFECEGDVNLLDDYPLLFFNCNIEINDKKKFFKIFSIKLKEKNTFLKIFSKGNLNLINKKINFDNIVINNNEKVSSEDLKYLKNTFESILFDKNFLKIFNLEKIKKFIIEIS